MTEDVKANKFIVDTTKFTAATLVKELHTTEQTSPMELNKQEVEKLTSL